MKTGFIYNNKRIYFMEGKGKDISFQRWRVTLYYQPNFAMTKFFPTQELYDEFLAAHDSECYKDYDEYKEDAK